MTVLVAAAFIRANNARPLSKRRVDAPLQSELDAAVEHANLLVGRLLYLLLLVMIIVILLMLQIEEFGWGWLGACCGGAFHMGCVVVVLLGCLSSRRLCLVQGIVLEKATWRTLLLFVLTKVATTRSSRYTSFTTELASDRSLITWRWLLVMLIILLLLLACIVVIFVSLITIGSGWGICGSSGVIKTILRLMSGTCCRYWRCIQHCGDHRLTWWGFWIASTDLNRACR